MIPPALLAWILLASPAAGQARVQLTPALAPITDKIKQEEVDKLKQQEGPYGPTTSTLPYLPAQLTVTLPPGLASVQAARLRDVQGGPTILLPLTVPPGTTRSAIIRLPAWSQQQTYDLALLAEDRPDAAVIDSARVNLAWPPDAASRDAMLAPQEYEQFEQLPRWDAALVRNLFLLLVAFALACAGAILVRIPLARAGLLVVLAAGAGGGAWLLVRSQPLVVQREVDRGDCRLLVLTTRRTTVWETPRPLWPVYFSPRQMRDDDLLLSVGQSTRLTLRPDDVRILRDLDTPKR